MTDTTDTRLGRIEGKLETMLEMQKEHNAQTASLAARIRSLEGSRSYFLGAAAVVAAFSAIITTKLKAFLGL